MKSPLLSLLLILVGANLFADVAVVFKVFPREYEVFSQGERQNFSVRADGNRVYLLPAGKARINLSAADSLPLSLALDVQPGMPMVQAKLEPRDSLLTKVAEGPTGRGPRNLAFSADGKKLFVGLLQDASVEVYDVPSLKKTGKLVPSSGSGGFTDVLVLADRKEIWALETDGNLQIFDSQKLSWKENVSMTGGGNVFFLALGAGKIGYYNADSGTVVQLDPATRKQLSAVGLNNTPRGAGITPSTVFLSLFDAGRLAVIDTATWKQKETWSAGKAPRPVAAIGDVLYVGDMGAAQVLVFSIAAKKLTGTLSVGSNPHAMTVSPDKKWVALATRGKNNPNDYQLPGPDFGQVSLLDAKGNLAATVWGRNQPTGLAFSADGQYLAFTDALDDNLELYRLPVSSSVRP